MQIKSIIILVSSLLPYDNFGISRITAAVSDSCDMSRSLQRVYNKMMCINNDMLRQIFDVQ